MSKIAVGRPVPVCEDNKRQKIEVAEVSGAYPVETEVATKTTYRHTPPTDEAGTQTETEEPEVSDETCNGPPSMRGRSHAEVTVTSHLLEALFGTAGATLEALWAALRRGDRFERSDAAFELADGLVVLFEWDGGTWHGEDRIAQDMRKLKRMLATDPRAIIVRARADGAPPLDEAAGAGITEQADRDRIVLVNLGVGRESQNPSWALRAITKALAPRLRELGGAAQDVYSQRLQAVGEQTDVSASHTSKHARDLVHETNLKGDAAYAQALLDLEAVVCSPEAARRIHETHGVVTRLDTVVVALKRLRYKYHVPVANLSTFMCGCFAAHIEEAGLWQGLDRMLAHGVRIERLHLFEDSFWKRVGDNALTEGIARLVACGVAIERLCCFCGSFWAHIGHESLIEGVERLVERGIAIERLHNFGNSFWAAIGDESFTEGVERLIDRGIEIERLHSFGNSFWARAGDDALATGIAALVDHGVAIERLQSFRNSFWCRMGDATLATNFTILVGWLLNTIGISIDKLASFANNDSFFSTDESTLRESIEMLTSEYGVRPDDLPAYHTFWVHVKKPGKLAELRAYLATCRTTGAVNARLKRLNGQGFGRGATKCKFARPKLEPSHVEPPKASKQASLGSFFEKRA